MQPQQGLGLPESYELVPGQVLSIDGGTWDSRKSGIPHGGGDYRRQKLDMAVSEVFGDASDVGKAVNVIQGKALSAPFELCDGLLGR
jgi:hypothetical protein